MSLTVIYAIFALVMGIVMTRILPLDEANPAGVVVYFLVGVIFAPVVLVFFVGLLFIAALQFVATVGRR